MWTTVLIALVLFVSPVLNAEAGIDYSCLHDCVERYGWGYCHQACSYDEQPVLSHYQGQGRRVLDTGFWPNVLQGLTGQVAEERVRRERRNR